MRTCFRLISQVWAIQTDSTGSEIKAYEEGIFGDHY